MIFEPHPNSVAMSPSASAAHQPYARRIARRDHAPVRTPAMCLVARRQVSKLLRLSKLRRAHEAAASLQAAVTALLAR